MRAERSGKGAQAPSRTRWFSVQTEPPVRRGFYERKCLGLTPSDNLGWWGSKTRFPSHEWSNACRNCKWRGLSTNPSEPKRGQRTK